jgi:predicted CoA-binding protein
VVDEDAITRIVTGAQRLAVVGWSTDPDRPSREVADYLDEHGYEIVPVNPNHAGERAHGTRVLEDLREIEGPTDVVLVFRRPQAVPEHVQEAIDANVLVVWMQEGVRNEDAAARLRQAGIEVVQDRCFAKEHRRLV